jgi:hypothetical protein
MYFVLTFESFDREVRFGGEMVGFGNGEEDGRLRDIYT